VGAESHGFIAKYQGLTVDPGANVLSVAPSIFDLLAKHNLTRSRMVRPIVQRYVRSGTVDNTRQVFPLLTAISKKEWTDQLVQDVLSAAKNNKQVAKASLSPGESISDLVRGHLMELGLLSHASLSDDVVLF
jgi:hypothetical protein